MLDVWQLNEPQSGQGKPLFYYQGLAEKIEDQTNNERKLTRGGGG